MHGGHSLVMDDLAGRPVYSNGINAVPVDQFHVCFA